MPQAHALRAGSRPKKTNLAYRVEVVRDGLEVLKRLRQDPRTKHVPVVVLTSSQEQVDVTETYALGVNSLVVKPVGFDAFMVAVRELGLYWLLLNQAPDGGTR